MRELRILRYLMFAVAGLMVADLADAVAGQEWGRMLDKITIMFLCLTILTLTKTADHDRERP